MSSTATTRSNEQQQPKTAKEVIAANVQNPIEQLEAGHSDALAAYLNAMSRFHRYSLGDVLEIARQKPDAIRVVGFWKWKELVYLGVHLSGSKGHVTDVVGNLLEGKTFCKRMRCTGMTKRMRAVPYGYDPPADAYASAPSRQTHQQSVPDTVALQRGIPRDTLTFDTICGIILSDGDRGV